MPSVSATWRKEYTILYQKHFTDNFVIAWLFEDTSKIKTNKEKIQHILQFFFDKSEIANQAVENIEKIIE